MTSDVVVLGLGRMGGAMVSRLEAAGFRVTSWSRRGGGTARTAGDALAHDGPVVLALYDGRACREVLDSVRDSLAGRLVVGTSTIGVDEAGDLSSAVGSAGGRYVHAPVLGSVPAVRDGSLLVLAGGDVVDVAEAGAVLSHLARQVRHVGTAREAAAAKLVANSSLAGAMLALRDSLAAAWVLDLPLTTALDLLEEGRLGGVVQSVRPKLERPDGPANFTVEALAKDLELLAAAGGPAAPAERLRQLMADGELVGDDDVSALALPASYRVGAR